MDITPLRIYSDLMNCFNIVIFLPFYYELKFHVSSRDGKLIGLSSGIKISVLSQSGHSTFVLSTIDLLCQLQWQNFRLNDLAGFLVQ